MLNHLCLMMMLLIYSYAIYNVYTNYTENNKSISSILKEDECNDCVMNSMILMGFFTLIYEYIRDDWISFISILFLLLGIYGLLMFDDTTRLHYVYSCMVFLSIIIFMISHTIKTSDGVLSFILFVQICLSIFTITQTHLLYGEIYLLANFCVFYLVLHFIPANICINNYSKDVDN
jgi:hypothetical protein